MRSILRCLVVLFFFCISGCGFHLRNPAPLEPQFENMYLQSEDPYGQLTRNLRQYFKMNGVRLANSAKESSIVLNILKEEEGQQLLSVGGTLETRQYNLTYIVTYQLQDPNGQVIVPNQTSTELRTLTIQASQILGGSNEAESMYEQMREAILYDIMNRLSSKDITSAVIDFEKKRKKL